MTQGVVTGVSVSHQHASLDEIESVGGQPDLRLAELLSAKTVSEAFVLETCNRVEGYVVTPEQTHGIEALLEVFPIEAVTNVQWLSHQQALEHLLRVAGGLESMSLGEDEILGQFRTARDHAQDVDALGPVLSEVLVKAIRVGERARTETAINEGVTSLSRAAINLIERHSTIEGATALVVGAGDMAALAAAAVADANIGRMIICNRTPERAEKIASKYDVAELRTLESLPASLVEADVAITATGSQVPLVHPDQCSIDDPTIIVDLGQPRDVAAEVGDLPTVDLFDLDDLKPETAAAKAQRTSAATEVESIVETELARLDKQLKRTQADDVIRHMYTEAMNIKQQEFETALRKLDDSPLSESEQAIVSDMAEAIVGRLMAAPIQSLRTAAENEDWETLQTALHLFDPEFDDGSITDFSDQSSSVQRSVTDER